MHPSENQPLLRGERKSISRSSLSNYYGTSPNPSTPTNDFDKQLDREFPQLSTFQSFTADDFNPNNFSYHNKLLRSGRIRKKTAARAKYGEFQTKKRKRRLYFCSIASDINIEKLQDYISNTSHPLLAQMNCRLYEESLHIYPKSYQRKPQRSDEASLLYNLEEESYITDNPEEEKDKDEEDLTALNNTTNTTNSSTFNINEHEAFPGKEIFLFDYGPAVFWGFSQQEVSEFLEIFRKFVTKGLLSKWEFEAAEDDIAFIIQPYQESTTTRTEIIPKDTSEHTNSYYHISNITQQISDSLQISISNDVITLPDTSLVSTRLAISFAIAQSSILSLFEARVEQKVENYRYIPEILAKNGKIDLSLKELGIMIGEVYVIRHEVNLHSEILDIPDYFWKENLLEPLYRLMLSYMELKERLEVLNNRMDLLSDLLRMIQHQHETAHGVKLEWIVIWLIFMSVALEILLILGKVFNWRLE